MAKPKETNEDHVKAPPPMTRITKDLFLCPMDHNNLGTFRCLTSRLLQVDYSDSFYESLQKSGSDLVRIAFFKDIAVGSVCAKILTEDDGPVLYIMTLGVLPMFEKLGIGSAMVKFISEKGKERGCIRSNLHVWEKNPKGKTFYERMGYTEKEFNPTYYRNISPHGASLLTKDL